MLQTRVTLFKHILEFMKLLPGENKYVGWVTSKFRNNRVNFYSTWYSKKDFASEVIKKKILSSSITELGLRVTAIFGMSTPKHPGISSAIIREPGVGLFSERSREVPCSNHLCNAKQEEKTKSYALSEHPRWHNPLELRCKTFLQAAAVQNHN